MAAKISMIAAIGRSGKQNRALGKENALLWRIPDDLQRFKALTKGHPIIMGRKTFLSIGRPLPERTNIVISRNTSWMVPGIHVRHSLDEAIAYAQSLNTIEVFIIGGAEVYAQALPRADTLYLTLIDDEKEADSFFPAYEETFTKETFSEEHEWDGISYRWVTLERN